MALPPPPPPRPHPPPWDAPIKICKGGQGIFFPLFGTEHTWDPFIQATLYLIGLLWAFIGVSIISEVFMAAIEKITSQSKQVLNPETGKKYTVKVWNDTVANLTLMALGSSAPEILLNVIGIFGDSFYSGDLGPSTIVGSASFNLLIISAVCIVSIPEGEPPRRIKEISVFVVTGSFSIFAYVWLLYILIYQSPDVVESWEAVLTFIFFIVLTIIAYMADKGYFGEQSKGTQIMWSDLTQEQLADMLEEARKDLGNSQLSDSQILEFLKYQFEGEVGKSRAAYRAAATKKLSGAKQASKSSLGTEASMAFEMQARKKSFASPVDMADDRPKCRVHWESLRFATLATANDASIVLSRLGAVLSDVEVVYNWGFSESGVLENQDTAVLRAGQERCFVNIHVKDAADQDLQFDIVQAKCKDPNCDALIGTNRSCHLVVLGEGLPGNLACESEEIKVEEADDTVTVEIKVVRSVGFAGAISCSYTTQDDSAIAGADYIETSGTLEFEAGEHDKTIKVDILPKGKFEGTEKFRVLLSDATGGARFDPKCDGGPDFSICTVVIEANRHTRIKSIMTQLNWDLMATGRRKWVNQFKEACYCNGSWEGQNEASHLDWVMHVLSFPWKMFFATCPPVEYMNGWLCFVFSLTMIGILTAMIGDLAQLLGCAVDIPDAITAITFVAMGTSLPDTFASMAAAQQDPFADASLGNITGSNSVNVFLGLGLPWLIAAIAWEAGGPTPKWSHRYQEIAERHYPHAVFVVEAGNISYSVTVFTVCALACFAILYARRRLVGGELGGPKGLQYFSSAVLSLMWVVYIALSARKALEHPGDTGS